MSAAATATKEDVLERVRVLLPNLRERAAEDEASGRLAPESVQELLDAGLARILVPRRFGGYELSLDAWLDTVLEISRVDASAGWCAGLLTHIPHYVTAFPEAGQEELWADGPDVPLAGSLMPAAQITAVEGGFRVSGHGPFASGVGHSRWAFVSGLVFGEGPPEWTILLVPAEEFEILPTWDVAAMRATGSNTILVDDVFVPASRAITLAQLRDGTGPGGAVHASPRFRLPLTSYGPIGFVAPMLGAAQGAYAYQRDWLKGRKTLAGLPAAEILSIQVRLARVAADLDLAELLLRRMVAVAEDDVAPDLALRARAMRDCSRATELLVAAIDTLLELGGTSSFATGNPVERAWRDIHFASAHISLNREENYGHYGRTELGVERPPMQPFF